MVNVKPEAENSFVVYFLLSNWSVQWKLDVKIWLIMILST